MKEREERREKRKKRRRKKSRALPKKKSPKFQSFLKRSLNKATFC